MVFRSRVLALVAVIAACASPKPAESSAQAAPPANPAQPESPAKPAAEKKLPVLADAEFAELVAKTYDFHFATLDETGKKTKGAELDAFWKKVKDDPKRLLPALRHELDRTDRPSAFFHDGAYLLFTLSKEQEDRERILATLARGNVDDIQPKIYVGIVIALANEGFDTTPAAFRLLEKPDFKLFLPDHFITVDRDNALLPMLLPTKPEYVMPAIEKRFATERDASARRSLLNVAYFTVTVEGDALIRRAADDAKEDAGVLDGAKRLLGQIDAARSFDPKSLKESLDEEKIPEDAAAARKLRRKYLRGLSDESLPAVDGLTSLMRKLGEPLAK
jgi:hypothetical protein